MFVAASSSLLVNYYYMGIPMHWCCARILLVQSYTTNTHDHDDDDDASTKENQFFQGIRSVFCFYVHHDLHHHTLGNMLFSLPVLVCRCVCVCICFYPLSFVRFDDGFLLRRRLLLHFDHLLQRASEQSSRECVCVWERNYIFWQTVVGKKMCVCVTRRLNLQLATKLFFSHTYLLWKAILFFAWGFFFLNVPLRIYKHLLCVRFVTKLWITT